MTPDPNWRRLDELLRDPNVEGKRFVVEDDHRAAIREALGGDEGGASMVAWLQEAAYEIANAHVGLDALDVPRRNPETGNPFTLAARIAWLAGVR